ncbi:MAG: hypothetical protein MR388_01870 [Tenericutes bacterium]|nr:hypothetical protein [Mycoplasmatota bacterium]
MEFILIAIIILFVLEYTKKIDTKKFIGEAEPYFRFLMEDDYKFLLSVRYGDDVDVNQLFSIRVRNGVVTIVVLVFVFLLSNFSFINLLLSFIAGYLIFKQPYMKLQKYYKNNLSKIDQMLPYYLKSLEILVQHYTVPVALRKSIDTAPEIFKSGLTTLVEKIEAGVSTVDPYMDFAKEYPVRDSMRMMRLLYRLGLGSQENKQEQLLLFSRTVSTLQNKAREQKYKERLDKMENKTMQMLMVTGGGILLLLLYAMMSMMNF